MRAGGDSAGNPVCFDTSQQLHARQHVRSGRRDHTRAQVAFLNVESSDRTRTSLAQARATVSGDFGVAMPWADDAISFALGGEYRQYTASVRADTLGQSGDLGGAGGATPTTTGGYDVYEGFGELIAPLVQDSPFFNSLTLEAGVRYSHYTIDAPDTPEVQHHDLQSRRKLGADRLAEDPRQLFACRSRAEHLRAVLAAEHGAHKLVERSLRLDQRS